MPFLYNLFQRIVAEGTSFNPFYEVSIIQTPKLNNDITGKKQTTV